MQQLKNNRPLILSNPGVNPIREKAIIYISGSQPFLVGDTHFANEKLATQLKYPNYYFV
jgi:hypothetical protein